MEVKPADLMKQTFSLWNEWNSCFHAEFLLENRFAREKEKYIDELTLDGLCCLWTEIAPRFVLKLELVFVERVKRFSTRKLISDKIRG